MRGRWFRGWNIVGAAFVVLGLAYGAQFSYGVFVKEIEADTGWSRTALALPYAVYVALYSMLSSASGVATDRRGPRPVIAFGGLVLGAGWALTGLAQELWQLYVSLGVITAIGMSASWVPCNATVVRWFVARRGLAVGIASSGGSFGNFFVPPLVAVGITAWGWRPTLVVVGVVVAVGLWVAATQMERSPEDVGLHPDGAAQAPPALDAVPDATAAEARSSPVFWLIFGIFAMTFLVVFVPFVHISAFAGDLGYEPVVAATVISAIGIGGMSGRLVVGYWSDRIDRRWALATMLLLQAAAFTGFALAQGIGVLYVSAVAFGFGYGGGVIAFPALVADQFGRAWAGSIVGMVFASAGSFAAIGPFVAAWLFDATGSYRVAFLLSAAANLVSLALLAWLRSPRSAPTSAAAAA